MTEAPARAALLLLALGASTGCASAESTRSLRRSPAGLAARAGSSAACVRPTLGADSPYRLPLAGPVDDPELLPYLAPVPAEVRRTLVATGLEPLLAKMLRERAQHLGTLTLTLLAQHQELATQLGSLDSQLASVLFEVDCTGDTLEDLMHEFDRREHARELELTVASLVVGAVAGVVAGVWDVKDRDGNGPPVTAAVGAGAAAALGISAFLPYSRKVSFTHPRNLLGPLLRGEDPQHIYPTFVFRLLTLPLVDGGQTPRDELVERWRELLAHDVTDERRAHAEDLLFGIGGVYSGELLELRQTMLDQLESSVGALHRDLELLERYLTRLSTEAPAN